MGFDLSLAWDTVQRLLNGFIEMLPRLVLGIVLFVVFVFVAKGVAAVVRRGAARAHGDRPSLVTALARLAKGATILAGLLVAVTASFPTFSPGDLITLLGVGSVAIGFAFKDIFQNYLAGILILFTRPFRVGDQIVFGDFEGTVEDIQTRATYIRTYDGRRVVIPSGELYTNSVTVNTAFEKRRWQYDIGIGFGDDVEQARAIILRELEAAEDVAPDPKADVIVVDLAESSVNLRARWWTHSQIADGLKAQDRVLSRVKRALVEAGIDLPFPTRQILFHDQTEETDGDRRRQREGWPAGSGDAPRPRRIADAIHEARAAGDRGNGADAERGGEGRRAAADR